MMDGPSHSSAKKYLPISNILVEQTSGEGVSCNAFSHDAAPSRSDKSSVT
jgi:hypothetical protein